MITKINASHPIFQNPEYLKDIVPFNLIEAIKSSAKLMLSDERSFIICSVQKPAVPVWVWTANYISNAETMEMCACFMENFKKDIYFVAKPHTASAIVHKYTDEAVHRIHMQSYECPKLIPPKNKDVAIENPVSDDIEAIARFSRNFSEECFGREKSIKDCKKAAEEFINTPKAFVIRQDGKIVCMAKSARETEKHIAINEVYTLPEYRGRGFAAAIVAHICELIFKEGKTPLLYTDLKNKSSNKAYTNIGFVPRGKVDEVKIK